MTGIIGAFAGALGFACMYNLSGRNLWLAAFNGMMSMFSRKLQTGTNLLPWPQRP